MRLWEKLKNIGGTVIGLLELAGLKYPVRTYMSQVDGLLWRGSRLPNEASYADIKRLGFNLIVNLCAENDMDAQPADKIGLRHFRIPIIDNTPPTQEQMILFLQTVTGNPNNKVLTHCEAGRGRTGVAVACYRMSVCGWSLNQALDEAQKFGLTLQDQEEFLRKFYLEKVVPGIKLNA